MKKPTLSQRMNKLETSINELTKLVKDGFTELRQDVKDIKIRLDKIETRLDGIDSRLDGIDSRLDYIVKANNLKDSK